MARTTLVIDEERLVALKRLAAERRQTLSSVVDQFLQEGLGRAEGTRNRKRAVRLLSFNLERPACNVSDRDQLFEVLDGR